MCIRDSAYPAPVLARGPPPEDDVDGDRVDDLTEHRRARRSEPEVPRLCEGLPELEHVDVEDLAEEVGDNRRDEELGAATEDLRDCLLYTSRCV